MTVIAVSRDPIALTLTIVAEFDAPAKRVWQVWNDPRQQLSVDGVMQAPGGPDENRRGGFERGGWAHFDDEAAAFVGHVYQRADAFLLSDVGRHRKHRQACPTRVRTRGITVGPQD